jgi:3-oxoacyl-[acyl-carrier-protein] synthase II
MTRIAITGAGSINALGTGVETFAEALRDGRSGLGPLSVIEPAGFRAAIAAQVMDLNGDDLLPPAPARRASRSALLALRAAREAWTRAGLSAEDALGAGIVLGTTTGGMSMGEENYRPPARPGRQMRRAARWLESPVSVPVDLLSGVLAIRGPRLTVSTACSSGANALGLGADWIRAGRAGVVLCGGTDSICRGTYAGFDVLQALDPSGCRPFDRRRAGLTIGEGAALFVLESWERARRRGATILGELVSYGISADAYHLTQPRPDGAGAIQAMRRALQGGGVAAEEIDYVNAHGTGTPLNDVIETRAIKAVLGPRAYRIPVSSTKSMVGHCLGAAGAIEALASLLAIREGFVPPTLGLDTPDPECDLDYVPRLGRPERLRTVLSNSYGFGGNNTSIILREAA